MGGVGIKVCIIWEQAQIRSYSGATVSGSVMLCAIDSGVVAFSEFP